MNDTRTSRGGLKAIAGPGWIAVILLGVVFATLCWTVLAPWQFSRHDERSERNALIHAAIDAPPVPLHTLMSTADQPAADVVWKRVTATGTYLADQQVYVGLRQLNGKPAFEIVLPFRLSTGEVVLVDRGYLIGADYDSGYRPDAPPTGEVTITGRVQTEQPDPSGRSASVVDDRTEVRGISAEPLLAGPDPVIRGFVQLTADAPGALIPIEVPQTESGPYLSYAYQWITFGAAALIAVLFFAYREVTDPVVEDDDQAPVAVPGQPDPAPTARTRRSRGFDKSQLYD